MSSETNKNWIIVLVVVLIVIVLSVLITNYINNRVLSKYEDEIESLRDSIELKNSEINNLNNKIRINEGRIIELDSMINRKIKDYNDLMNYYENLESEVKQLSTDEAIEYLRKELETIN